ncbi:EVE domain-containing protein [Vulcanisaeta sp. JCM 16159]|uniref:EVE domain-containing protein n=1 Tax=Vulcanisaeta sp. JCM 16159 TaxID=1295371 RepID=UPI000AB066F0|nr:EVE domain-containing protein [Vulcanisaeta sp. JCM 16159]
MRRGITPAKVFLYLGYVLLVNYWLVIMRERVFMGIVETGLFGCRDPECGLLMTRVRPGTRLVLFVSGFGCKSYCKSFVGVFEVVGDWVKAGKKLNDWSHVVEVKPISLGRVELGSIANNYRSLGVGGALPRPCTPWIHPTPGPCQCPLRMRN